MILSCRALFRNRPLPSKGERLSSYSCVGTRHSAQFSETRPPHPHAERLTRSGVHALGQSLVPRIPHNVHRDRARHISELSSLSPSASLALAVQLSPYASTPLHSLRADLLRCLNGFRRCHIVSVRSAILSLARQGRSLYAGKVT